MNVGELREFQVFCLGIIGTVAVTTLWLRFWKGRLRHISESEGSDDALQFGIKDIFIWTTTIAILLGIGHWLMKFVDEAGAPRDNILVLILGLAISIALATVVNIWALLGHRVSIVKLITLVLVTAAAATADFFLIPNGFFFVCVTLIAQILFLLMLVVLRSQGLRFVR